MNMIDLQDYARREREREERRKLQKQRAARLGKLLAGAAVLAFITAAMITLYRIGGGKAVGAVAGAVALPAALCYAARTIVRELNAIERNDDEEDNAKGNEKKDNQNA